MLDDDDLLRVFLTDKESKLTTRSSIRLLSGFMPLSRLRSMANPRACKCVYVCVCVCAGGGGVGCHSPEVFLEF